jgi:hypothetical protein
MVLYRQPEPRTCGISETVKFTTPLFVILKNS